MERLHYTYQASWKLIIGVTAMFGACLALFGYKTATNDVGVVINHAIELGPQGATIFYACLALASLGFVGMGLTLAVGRSRFDHHLTVDQQGIELPRRPWARDHVRVAFADIVDMKHQSVNGTHFLVVRHKTGKVTIDRNKLPSKADFELVMRTIVERVESLAR